MIPNFYQIALSEFKLNLFRSSGRRETDISEADRQRILARAEQLRKSHLAKV